MTSHQNNLARRNHVITPFYVMALLDRAKQLATQGQDVIHMGIGEPDFPTPQAIVDAGISFISKGRVHYTPASGLVELRKKIAQFYAQYYQVNVDYRRIIITPGASGALLLAFGLTLNPDESILLADPCYPCNSNFAHLFSATTQRIPTDAKQQYQLNSQLIASNWTKQSKGVLIASPSNPTGTVIDPQLLQGAINTTLELGGCFYSDEIYHGLVYETPAVSALQFSDEVFVINSFSKYFGMTGWRVGWLVVPDSYIDAAEKLAQNIFIATSTESQYAALAALSDTTRVELENRKQQFQQRRDFLYQRLLNFGFDIAVKPQGAFYIYADCSNLCRDSYQFALDLLETQAVVITPGRDFGDYRAKAHLRFAYTNSIERMEIAMQRLESFLNR